MIHLDTNLLLAASRPGDAHAIVAGNILKSGEELAVSSVAWMEFRSRPMDPLRLKALHTMLAGGVVPFDEAVAVLAGQLHYATGSNRRTRLDTMIAATAIHTGADLATVNPGDFAPFLPFGLRLHPLP